MTEPKTDHERIARAVAALREPAAPLARVPNTIRQSIADVIDDLVAVIKDAEDELIAEMGEYHERSGLGKRMAEILRPVR